MKIVVNARFLLHPYTGIGQYTKHMLRALSKIDKKNEYVLLVPKRVKNTFGKNFRVKVLPELRRGGAGIKKTYWEQISVPETILREKADVAWFPYPANPWNKGFYKKGVRVLLTVHDCIPWKHREYRKGLLSKMYHYQSKRAVRLANEVLTVSKSSAGDIAKICEVPARRISLTYNDVDPVYKGKKGDANLLKKWGLKKGKYLLYCGGYDKRKGVERLVKEAVGEKLVLCGGQLHLGKLYESFGAEAGDLVRTGFLKEEDLKVLYENCKAFVHLSQEEGFNIPALEAANCGAPLVLSGIAVHKEIFAGGAMFVGNRKGALRLALAKISRKKNPIVGKYSWEMSAKVFKNLLK
ncbi:glycosyltransferase family 4 protein [Patescibacteria group bacterium]|nr:glycosyltransferase family 4 protein [Patescibacteria group bacterium]